MNPWQSMVADFHHKFGVRVGTTPQVLTPTRAQLRIDLIEEEAGELTEELLNGDIVGIADGIADLIYVVLGTAVEMGIDVAPIFEEVHRTNMAKVGGGTRADGKILKPEGWTRPQIDRLLREQGDK